MVQGINATAKGDLVGTDDASIHGNQTASNPPAEWVAEEVDLLACIVLGPKAHAPEKEWPLVRLTGIWMAAGQLTIMPEHRALQLEPLP